MQLLTKAWKQRLQNAAYVIVGIVLPAVLIARNLSSSGRLVVATVDGVEMLPDEVGLATAAVDRFDHRNPMHRQTALRRAVEIRTLARVAVERGLDRREPWRSRVEQEELFSLIMAARAHLMGYRAKDTYLAEGEFRDYVNEHHDDLHEPDDVSVELRIARSDAEVAMIRERLAAEVPLALIPLPEERHGLGEFLRSSKDHFYAPADIADAKLRRAIWRLREGERDGPIETPEGRFFVQMLARRPGEARSPEAIRRQLYPSLSRRLYDQTLRKKTEELAQRFPAAVDEDALEKLRKGQEVDAEAVVIDLPGRRISAKRILEVSRETAREKAANAPVDAAMATLLENNRLLLYARQNRLDTTERVARDIALWRQWVLYEAAIEDERSRGKPTEADIERGLKTIRERFAADPIRLHVEMLVLRDEASADRTLELLRKGATFESQAVHTVVAGGQTDFGWIWPWDLEPDVVDAFMKAPDGAIVGPVRSALGPIVGRVVARRDARLPAEAELEAIVVRAQTRRAQFLAEKRLRDEAWAKANVRVDADALAKMWTGASHFPGSGSHRISLEKPDAGAPGEAPGDGQRHEAGQ